MQGFGGSQVLKAPLLIHRHGNKTQPGFSSLNGPDFSAGLGNG